MAVAVDDDGFVTFRSILSGDGWNFPWLSGKNSQVAHIYWTHNFGTYSKIWILENPASRILKILFFPLGKNTSRISKIAGFTNIISVVLYIHIHRENDKQQIRKF